jgi:hypothetical protein
MAIVLLMLGYCHIFVFDPLDAFYTRYKPPVSKNWAFEKTKSLYGIAWSEIFIEPPPYAQQRRRRGERGTGVTKGS